MISRGVMNLRDLAERSVPTWWGVDSYTVAHQLRNMTTPPPNSIKSRSICCWQPIHIISLFSGTPGPIPRIGMTIVKSPYPGTKCVKWHCWYLAMAVGHDQVFCVWVLKRGHLMLVNDYMDTITFLAYFLDHVPCSDSSFRWNVLDLTNLRYMPKINIKVVARADAFTCSLSLCAVLCDARHNAVTCFRRSLHVFKSWNRESVKLYKINPPWKIEVHFINFFSFIIKIR